MYMYIHVCTCIYLYIYRVSYRIFSGGEVIVLVCVSTPPHASMCVPPGGGGGVWGHAPQENFDFYIILDCNPGENFYLDDTYQMTKHCTKFQEFWGGGNCGWGGGGGIFQGPPLCMKL